MQRKLEVTPGNFCGKLKAKKNFDPGKGKSAVNSSKRVSETTKLDQTIFILTRKVFRIAWQDATHPPTPRLFLCGYTFQLCFRVAFYPEKIICGYETQNDP
jgi:hypothetical protein